MTDFQGFDADAAVKAVTPPRIKWRGTAYEGRILSLPEVLPLAERWDELASEDATPVEQVRSLARRLFSELEVTDGDGDPFPIDEFVDEVPGQVLVEAIVDFLALQLEATGMNASKLKEMTETT